MRELKREEYGVISGGGVTQMPTLFVNGPPNGVYIPSAGTGNSPRGMAAADGGMGGERHIKNPSVCANGALASFGVGAEIGAGVGAVVGLGVGSAATAALGAVVGSALVGSGASAVTLTGKACRP